MTRRASSWRWAVGVALLPLGLGATALAQGGPETRGEMRGHYAQLLAIHDALVKGDLAAIRQPATELAYLSLPQRSPFGATAYGASIRDAARRVARETSVVGAARSTSSIVRACAGCHRAVGATPALASFTRERPGPAGSMADHQHAADEVLLGLLMPSDSRWVGGAQRLGTFVLPGDVAQAAQDPEAFRYISRRAARADTPAARESAYVQIVTACAGCHQAGR